MSEYERIIMLSVILPVNLEKKIVGLITSWEHEHEHHGNMNMNITGTRTWTSWEHEHHGNMNITGTWTSREHEHHGNMNMNIMGNMDYILIIGPKMKFACEYQIL